MAGPRLGVIAAFTKAKAIFFYKTVTTSMVSEHSKCKTISLELPALFIAEHGEKMSQVAALVRPFGSHKWWLRFKARHYSNFQNRVLTSGDGWRDFVLDNGISVGEFLVFELVHSSKLVVHVYPRDDPFAEESALSNSGPGSQKVEYGGFKKTLCASNGLHSKWTRLDIPAPFWRSHGMHKFDEKVYTLEGPRMKGDVKAHVSHSKVQIKCRFSVGWLAFYLANELKTGDTVVFKLTGKYQFAVSVEAP